jgi:hypothetical protein
MNKYQRSKIYKLVCDIPEITSIYIGHTQQKLLCSRMGEHRRNAKNETKKSKLYTTMREIGIDNWQIHLIENWPCISIDDARKREQYWIELLKPDLNMIAAKSELSKKERDKEFYQGNIVPILTKKKQYRKDNKEIIAAKQATVLQCKCGEQYTLSNCARHNKSKKHKQGMEDYVFDVEMDRLADIMIFDN